MPSKLLAIKVTGTTVSVAIFSDRRLEYTDTHHLANDVDTAAESAERFVRWIIEDFRVAEAVMEFRNLDDDVRSSSLSRMIAAILEGQNIPLRKIQREQILEAFGYPALQNRKQLHNICLSFWPFLKAPSETVLDALGLGFFVQIERLLTF